MTLYGIAKPVAHSCHVLLYLYITNIDVRKEHLLVTGVNTGKLELRLAIETSAVDVKFGN